MGSITDGRAHGIAWLEVTIVSRSLTSPNVLQQAVFLSSQHHGENQESRSVNVGVNFFTEGINVSGQ